jgi:hypothetical protein
MIRHPQADRTVQGEGLILSFQDITAVRFSLAGLSTAIFEEINLADAEYEP